MSIKKETVVAINDSNDDTLSTNNTNPIGPNPSTVVVTTSGSKKPLKIIVAIIVGVLVAATIVVLPIIFTREKSTTTEEDTTISTTTTSTTSSTITSDTMTSDTMTSGADTAIENPCTPGNLLWNRNGITVLDPSLEIATSGIYIDSDDTLYTVDENIHHVVWKLLQNAVEPTIIAGIYQSNGSSDSQLDYPNDVYVDRQGNLYVTDFMNHRIQKFINGSNIGITIAGITKSPGSSLNQLNEPRYFTFDSTDTYMYVVDRGNYRVVRYLTNSTSGMNGTLVAGGTEGGNTNDLLNNPWGIHYIPSVSDDLFITNMYGHSVMRWTPGASSGVFIAGTPGVAGYSSTQLNHPAGIKIDNYSNIYVVDHFNNRIQMFCANTQTGITIVGTGFAGVSSTELNYPRGIAFDSAMNMYISDSGNRRVQKFLKL